MAKVKKSSTKPEESAPAAAAPPALAKKPARKQAAPVEAAAASVPSKPAASKAATSKASASKPVASKPVAGTPAVSKASASKASASKPVTSKSAVRKPAAAVEAETAPAARESAAPASIPAKPVKARPAASTATVAGSAAVASEAPATTVRRTRKVSAARVAAPPAPVPVRQPAEPVGPPRQPTVRLHKFLAHGGSGSRREAETFIEQGRVSVNGKPITKLGFKVDPVQDRVLLDGEPITPEVPVYFMLHKPAGFICTNHDERGRPRAVDLLRGVRERVYTVGRLDADSLGLILISNDGDLANIVCHPRYRIQKRYQVAVKGQVTRDQIARLEAGVWLSEGKSSPAKVVPLGRNPRRNETILEMTIFEGRNREIRRVFAGIGLNVRRLLRVSLGPLELEGLQPGEAKQIDRKALSFVDDAKRLYEANKEAWDSELPTPEKKTWRPRPKREGGGGAGYRAAHPNGGPRREGGFGGPRREGGFGGPRREGGFGGPRREGGFGGPRREGGFGGGSGGGGYGDRPRPPSRRPFDGPPRGPGGDGPPPRPGGDPRRQRPHY